MGSKDTTRVVVKHLGKGVRFSFLEEEKRQFTHTQTPSQPAAAPKPFHKNLTTTDRFSGGRANVVVAAAAVVVAAAAAGLIAL